MKDLIQTKLSEAKKSTKVALIGGVVVVAGSWGSCQFQVAEPEAEAEKTVEIEENEETEAPKAKGGKEAKPEQDATE